MSSESNQTSSSAVRFADFEFPEALNRALTALGYETPTPVQAQAIPSVLEGKDVLATAQTGTGKTAAFALPLLKQMLTGSKSPALIVAPTRELAEQIGAMLRQLVQFTPQIKISVVIGGTSYQHQIRSLRNKPMFVVGTPGRLLDQIEAGHLQLGNFGYLVIDEADRLLDMGFEPQMNELVANLPADRQSLLFSATLPQEIVRLANSYLREPVRVAVGAVSKPVERIRQSVIEVTTKEKDATLLREIDKVAGSIIVFTKTKYKTERLAKFLADAGHYVARIHGDRSQRQRSGAIKDFREGTVRILVATDIAARGLDIPHIQHVVNYDLPMCPEDYIHRIGRTARAGAEGHSLSFVTPEEHSRWAQIYKLIHGRFPDDMPKRGRGSNRSERRAHLSKGKFQQHGPKRNPHHQHSDGRKSHRGAEQFENRRGQKPEQRGPNLSPRRQEELRAEKFLRDERRGQSKRPSGEASGPNRGSEQRGEFRGRKGSANQSRGQEARHAEKRERPQRSGDHPPSQTGMKKPKSRWKSITQMITGK